MDVLTLTANKARATVIPAMGAGMGGLWVDGLPALRPWPGKPADEPFMLANILLTPFSNRIPERFSFAGRDHDLPLNVPGDSCTLHGDGFQRGWRVTEARPDMVTLVLDDGGIGPFRYGAEVTYRLTPATLVMEMSLENRADIALPYGMGFHPWFPRNAATRLQFASTGHWPEDPHRNLPTTITPVPAPQDWDFSAPAPLPSRHVNNGFAGWDGVAQVDQGPDAVSLTITATDNLSTAILYSPGSEADFFCFEPVTHPVNAHNLPGYPGLVVLEPGAGMRAAMTLSWIAV
jgi:aldose 1-epimerase